MRSSLVSGLIAAAALVPMTAQARDAAGPGPDDITLRDGFRVPPQSARPRVWWHWMNGNISQDGIRKDIAWMKRVGIGGLQNFDVDLSTPQVVDKRLVYMTPEWKAAFRFAANEAERQGLELAIASSPGWSESGGPWVAPEDGLKKLVWSATVVAGGTTKPIHLPAPPAVAGPYQAMTMQPEISDLITGQSPPGPPSFYRDSRVVAVPASPVSDLPEPTFSDGTGKRFAHRPQAGKGAVLTSVFAPVPPELRLDYGTPVTVRAVTLHIVGAAIPLLGPLMKAELQASTNGQTWNDLAPVPLDEPPTTVAFAPRTARYFRVVVTPGLPGGGDDPATAEAKKNLAMDDVFGKAIGGLLGKPVTIDVFTLHADALVDRAEVKAGFALVPDYLALPIVPDQATGPAPATVIDLTSRMNADGTLDWAPPPGRWNVIRFGYSLLGKTNHPAPAEATGLEVDKYDADAVRRYFTRYLANYRDAAGADRIGTHGVRAMVTDSIEIGAANWTPRMLEQFKRLRGYDPVPWLPVLTGMLIGTRADSDRFLFDFRRTLSDLIASEHYATAARIAHDNGLTIYGESLEGARTSFGDDMTMRSHTDFPMAAMWYFDAAAGPNPRYVVDVKGAASIAHIYGQNIVAAESMTAAMAPWSFAPADLKHVIDLEFVLGVNRPVVHTSVHVPVDDRKPGLSLGGIGQFFNRNESWADLATPWVDYLARNAFMLQQGRNVADIAYFYGEEAPLSGLFGSHAVPDAPTSVAYDFINADVLTTVLTNEGGNVVSPGGARYRAIYLGGSSAHMTLPTLRRLDTLVTGGATVIGLAPVGSPGLADDRGAYAALVHKLWPSGPVASVGKGRVVASADVEAALHLLAIAPDFTWDGAKDADRPILFAHRRLADGDSYFLVNRTRTEQRVVARFRVTGKTPEIWHAETGASEPVAYRIVGAETIVPLTLTPEAAVHVVFIRNDTVAARGGMVTPVPRKAPLNGPWTIAFQEGRGAPATTTMTTLQPLNRNTNPGIRYFSGIATYHTTFRAPAEWQRGDPLALNLGDVRDIAEVTINGKLAGYAWHAPYTVDIARLVIPDQANDVQIRVANTWVNRLIRDADPKVTAKVTWTSTPTYKPDAPLRPSGLLGPITLN
ncbi:glycosyl hydrolase [Novosphingobium sp.]|uniref:glycosyl hydrolase n=1 Tax=Novosphingobium sp. TaxID=1874826 RepID=UPI003D15216B